MSVAPDAVHELRTIWVLWRREMVRLTRSRAQVLLMLTNPMMFLLVLGNGLNSMVGEQPAGDYRAYLFPGVLLLTVQMPALNAGMSIVRDREVGLLRAMLVAPVRRRALLVGKCLGGATAATVQGCLVLALAGLAGLPYRAGLLVPLLGELALVSLAMTAIGALAGVFIARIEVFHAVLGVALMPLFFLSGAVFSVDGLPRWLTALTLVNPLTYAVDAMRSTMVAGLGSAGASGTRVSWGGWVPPVGMELLAMCLLCLLALVAAARRFGQTG